MQEQSGEIRNTRALCVYMCTSSGQEQMSRKGVPMGRSDWIRTNPSKVNFRSWSDHWIQILD